MSQKLAHTFLPNAEKKIELISNSLSDNKISSGQYKQKNTVFLQIRHEIKMKPCPGRNGHRT